MSKVKEKTTAKTVKTKKVQPVKVHTPLIVVEKPEEITDESAAEIKAFFMPMLDKMEALEKEFNPIIAKYNPKKEPSPELVLEAKTLYKTYVSTRTGTEGIRKKAKSYYLIVGRMIDAFGNTQKAMGGAKEEKLKQIIDHAKRIEEAKIKKLNDDRLAELAEFDFDGSALGLGKMTSAIYDTVLAGAKHKKEQKAKEEKEAEELRLKTIEKTKVFNERKNEMLKFAPYHDQGLTIDTIEHDYEMMKIEAEGQFETEKQRIKNIEIQNAKQEENRKKVSAMVVQFDGAKFDGEVVTFNGVKVVSREELLGFTTFEFDQLKNEHNINYDQFVAAEREKEAKKKERVPASIPASTPMSSPVKRITPKGSNDKDTLTLWIKNWGVLPLVDTNGMDSESIVIYNAIVEKQKAFRMWSMSMVGKLK